VAAGTNPASPVSNPSSTGAEIGLTREIARKRSKGKIASKLILTLGILVLRR
jgi:hypothetical protein